MDGRMRAAFEKMHGTGNDFVVLDERRRSLGLTPARAAALADRHSGIGCDQVISIESSPRADAFMRIRNADGSEAGACGNATRCVASLLFREDGRRQIAIETAAGILPAEILASGAVQVDMGRARLQWDEIPLARPLDTLHLPLAEDGVADPAAASMGNPHLTFFVADPDLLPIERLGRYFEHHPLLPEGANVGFAGILAPDRMRLRVWERGAGATLACGSGACAAVVNAHRRGLSGRAVEVVMDGGILSIVWRADEHVLMTGPVVQAFTGEVDLSLYPA